MAKPFLSEQMQMGDLDLLSILGAATIGYFLGSIPYGLVVSHLFGLGDVRSIGSGSIGATNVLRTGNKMAAFLTMIGDGGKGSVAVLVAASLFSWHAGLIAGFFALIGHNYPVWLGFKGGKGVATFIGVQLALAFWPQGVLVCLTWLIGAALSKRSSVASLSCAAIAPLLHLVFGTTPLVILSALLAALIFIAHRANIGRILAGTEPRIGEKK